MNTIINDIKRTFNTGGMLVRIIYINLAVFVVAMLANIAASMNPESESVMLQFFAIPSGYQNLIFRPWSVFTYMFLHINFLHILFNLLILYWYGNIFLRLMGEKHLLGLYLIGGLTGAAMFVFAYALLPFLDQYPSYAFGASAPMLAVVFAAATHSPNLEVQLSFVGNLKLKYAALIVLVLDFVGILADENMGGHITHMGGALYGFIYMSQMKKKKDIAENFNKFIADIPNWFSGFKSNKKNTYKVSPKDLKANVKNMTDYEYNKQKNLIQEEIDIILDKISKYGYESLTKEEKEKLFGMNNKT